MPRQAVVRPTWARDRASGQTGFAGGSGPEGGDPARGVPRRSGPVETWPGSRTPVPGFGRSHRCRSARTSPARCCSKCATPPEGPVARRIDGERAGAPTAPMHPPASGSAARAGRDGSRRPDSASGRRRPGPASWPRCWPTPVPTARPSWPPSGRPVARCCGPTRASGHSSRSRPGRRHALIELLDDSSQGHFVVKVLPCLLRQGWWQGRLTMDGPDVDAGAGARLDGRPARFAPGLGPRWCCRPRCWTWSTPPAPAQRSAEEHSPALVEHVSDLIAVIEPRWNDSLRQPGGGHHAGPRAR